MKSRIFCVSMLALCIATSAFGQCAVFTGDSDDVLAPAGFGTVTYGATDITLTTESQGVYSGAAAEGDSIGLVDIPVADLGTMSMDLGDTSDLTWGAWGEWIGIEVAIMDGDTEIAWMQLMYGPEDSEAGESYFQIRTWTDAGNVTDGEAGWEDWDVPVQHTARIEWVWNGTQITARYDDGGMVDSALVADLTSVPDLGDITSYTADIMYVASLACIGGQDGDQAVINEIQICGTDLPALHDPDGEGEAEAEAEAEAEGEPEEVLVFISGPHLVTEGQEVTLVGNVVGGVGTDCSWTLDGEPAGADGELDLGEVTGDDEGTYVFTCTVDDAPEVSEDFELQIVDAVPLAGGLGLALLAGSCALAGAVTVRRKK